MFFVDNRLMKETLSMINRPIKIIFFSFFNTTFQEVNYIIYNLFFQGQNDEISKIKTMSACLFLNLIVQ